MGFYEKTLESEEIFKGKIIGVYRDTVELQNGRTSTREVVEHSGGVGILPIDADGSAILVRQFRYPIGMELLEVPAGKLEPGEDHFECAVRELSEETGYTAGQMIYLGSFLPSPGYCRETLHVYLALDLTPGGAHLDPDEFLSVERIPFDKLHKMVMDGEITDGKTVIGVLKAERYLAAH